MRLVPVFIIETYNQTNYKCLPKFVQTDNESCSIKTAIELVLQSWTEEIGISRRNPLAHQNQRWSHLKPDRQNAPILYILVKGGTDLFYRDVFSAWESITKHTPRTKKMRSNGAVGLGRPSVYMIKSFLEYFYHSKSLHYYPSFNRHKHWADSVQ